MLGLAEGIVILVDYDPGWSFAYAEEATRIRAALGPSIIEVQHCGSTAVPGIKAKPIMDIVAGVPDLAAGSACIEALVAIGYRYLGERIVPGEHFFGKGSPRTHHLHLTDWHEPRWNEKLAFRDRLQADRALARAYELVKLSLAARFPRDRAAYTAAKAAFVTPIVDGLLGR